jgi:hypothetical protein
MKLSLSDSCLALLGKGNSFHDVIRAQLLVNHLPFSPSIPKELRVEMAFNMYASRQETMEETTDPIEGMALELEELEDYDHGDDYLDQYLDEEFELDEYISLNEEERSAPSLSRKRPKRPYKPRPYFAPVPKEEVFWWNEWLAPDKAEHLRTADDTTDYHAKEFRSYFAVPYKVFEDLVELTKSKGFYDENKTDAIGNPCKDLGLLMLTTLHHLAHAYPFGCMKRETRISRFTQRRFFLDWVHSLDSIKADFVHLPRDDDEIRRVEGEFRKVGYPGCIGSLDAVQIGWDRCPAELSALYRGKEGYPTVGFQVSCTTRRFIQLIGKPQPGTRNDKTTIRYDATATAMRYGNHPLKSKKWDCFDANGNRIQHRGMYWIVDGGYLRWPSLICADPYSANADVRKMSPIHGGVRKDIECAFGILKRRFKWLKSWNELSEVGDIANVFSTCCILHNILLEHDGYLREDIPDLPSSFKGKMKWKFYDERGDCMQSTPIAPSSVFGGAEVESEWRDRIEAIASHQAYLTRV